MPWRKDELGRDDRRPRVRAEGTPASGTGDKRVEVDEAKSPKPQRRRA
jgi:hypothetical protein